MRTLSKEELQYWGRRALAWSPVWSLVLLWQGWAVWILITWVPTETGRMSSEFDSWAMMASASLVPLVLGLMIAVIVVGGFGARRLFRWCRRMDDRAQTESVTKSYLGK